MIHHNSSGFFVDFLLIVHGFSIMLRGCGFFINGCVILVHHPGGFSSSMVIGMSILHISSSSIHHQWWFLHGFSSSMNNSVIVPVVVPMSIFTASRAFSVLFLVRNALVVLCPLLPGASAKATATAMTQMTVTPGIRMYLDDL